MNLTTDTALLMKFTLEPPLTSFSLFTATLWDPVYYYDAYEKFLSTKKQCVLWIGPTQYCGDDPT